MKVSVALVTYNSEKYLSEQIDTILENLRPGDEIVVSDDGSSDSTINILNTYASKDSRFRIFQIDHRGCNGNYENAIGHCTGDVIFLSDDDNVWERGKVDRVLKVFEENPKIGFVQHDCSICDENLKEIAPSYFETRHAKPGLWRNIMRVSYGGSLIAFRRSLTNYFLPFPKNMPVFYDEWLGTMASKHSMVFFLPVVLSKWRRHGGSQSSGYVTQDGEAVIKKRRPFKGCLSRLCQRVFTRLVKAGWAIFR